MAKVRKGAGPGVHYTCSAKMGRDDMSVVDGNLRVYGIDRLRIAVGSIMPNVTTGNTMAPCVIIGERAAEIIRKDRAASVIFWLQTYRSFHAVRRKPNSCSMRQASPQDSIRLRAAHTAGDEVS